MQFFSTQLNPTLLNYYPTVPAYYFPSSFPNPFFYYNIEFSALPPQLEPPQVFQALNSSQQGINLLHISADPRQESTDDFYRVEVTQKSRKISKCDSKAKQKFGRNIVSNIFHMMINSIKRDKRMRKQVKVVIKKVESAIKWKEFFTILNKQSVQLESYITSDKMQRFWRGPEGVCDEQDKQKLKQVQFSKIFRILGKHYLMNYHVEYVYYCSKLKKASRELHCSAIRRIISL